MQRYYFTYAVPALAAILISLVGTVHAGTEDGRVTSDIWSGYWWPTSKGEILEPLTTYDTLTGRKAAQWHRTKNPSEPNIPKWYGLCHAWAASSIMEIEPKKPVTSGNKVLSVGDQKGLLALCHDNDVANFYGDRFGDGIGSEDMQDLAPDQLWMILRKYIKEQGVPIVLDLEPGPEVWNYPAFAYRVEYRPIREGSPIHQGTISIWFADDSVPKNFVGLKRVFQQYRFQVEMRGASVVMGTGKWLSDSEKNHPDFAWFPYVVRSSNPEMDYDLTCKLLGRPATRPTPPTPTPATTPVETMPVETTPVATMPVETTPVATMPVETTPVATMPAEAEAGAEDQRSLTLSQLLLLLEGEKSDFVFDITAGNFDGKYRENELLTINGISKSDGYLYLFGIDPDGKFSVLYPQPEDDNRVMNDKPFTVPSQDASYQFRLTKPYGGYRIRGVVSEKPLRFTGEYVNSRKPDAAAEKQVLDWNELLMRVIPAEWKLADENIRNAKGATDFPMPLLEQTLGRFSQDEVILYVGPGK